MKMPICSIILPVFNRERFIGEAVQSVLAQSLDDWELIVVDDASTDCSLNVVRDVAGADPRVKVLPLPVNVGTPRAIRAGEAVASGKYFATLDSDDRLYPQCLERTAKVLDEMPQVGVAYTHYDVIDENNRVLGLGERCRVPYDPNRLLTVFMSFHFRLVRLRLLRDIGSYNPRMRYVEDYDLCLRLAERTAFAEIREVLYSYRSHGESIGRTVGDAQRRFAAAAVRQALKRRELHERFKLLISPSGRFSIVEKDAL